MKLGATLATALAVAVVLGLAGPAAAAPEPTYGGPLSDEVKLKVAKQLGGNYKNTIELSMNDGQVKNVYLKAKSLTDTNEPADLFISRYPSGVFLRWFTKSGANITGDVASAFGYDFTVKPEKPRQFRVRIKFTGDADTVCYLQPLADDDVPVQTSEPLTGINVSPLACA